MLFESICRRWKSLYQDKRISLSEKRFILSNGESLKYLFSQRHNNDILIIVFSGMSEDKAKYNYINNVA